MLSEALEKSRLHHRNTFRGEMIQISVTEEDVASGIAYSSNWMMEIVMMILMMMMMMMMMRGKVRMRITQERGHVSV